MNDVVAVRNAAHEAEAGAHVLIAERNGLAERPVPLGERDMRGTAVAGSIHAIPSGHHGSGVGIAAREGDGSVVVAGDFGRAALVTAVGVVADRVAIAHLRAVEGAESAAVTTGGRVDASCCVGDRLFVDLAVAVDVADVLAERVSAQPDEFDSCRSAGVHELLRGVVRALDGKRLGVAVSVDVGFPALAGNDDLQGPPIQFEDLDGLAQCSFPIRRRGRAGLAIHQVEVERSRSVEADNDSSVEAVVVHHAVGDKAAIVRKNHVELRRSEVLAREFVGSTLIDLDHGGRGIVLR